MRGPFAALLRLRLTILFLPSTLANFYGISRFLTAFIKIDSCNKLKMNFIMTFYSKVKFSFRHKFIGNYNNVKESRNKL